MMLPKRQAGWRGRLYAFLAAADRQPHVYGQLDCALLIAGGVDAMHGTNFGARFKGRYTTYRGGLRVLRREGYKDHLDLVASHARRQALMSAQIGDIAVVDTPDHPALGWVVGDHIQILNQAGLVVIPLMTVAENGPQPTASEIWRT